MMRDGGQGGWNIPEGPCQAVGGGRCQAERLAEPWRTPAFRSQGDKDKLGRVEVRRGVADAEGLCV